MRLRTLGAVCVTCATASTSTAVAQAPTSPPPPAADPVLRPPGDMHIAAKRQLIERHMHFARKLGHLRSDPLTRSERRRRRVVLHGFTLAELRVSTRRVAREVRRARQHRFGGAPNVPIPPVLEQIARCESHSDPRAVSAGGTYRGKYQFSFSTWASVGGDGDPAAASETEQDRRAAVLYRSGGPGHWPVCGR
jgi:transglycosylase-like protein